MQFIYDGVFYKAIKISGPKHNFLGLNFDSKIEGISDYEVIVLEDKNTNTNIESTEVIRQVQAGVEEINERFGTNFIIRQIQYVATDTPSENVYKELTIEILTRFLAKQSFTQI